MLSRHRVVNAGAGTGKTHALLTQYLHLITGFSALPSPLEPRSIAALTFTEKAAAEMRERLGRRLLALVRADESTAALAEREPDLAASATSLGRSWPSAGHFDLARSQLASAPIGTFHSFASALLRRHALSVGIEPDFDLLDEETARDLLGEACERAVLAALEAEGGEQTAQDAAELVTEFGFAGDHGLVAALCRLLAMRGEEGSGAVRLDAAYSEVSLEGDRARLLTIVQASLQSLAGIASELSGKSAERVAQAQQLSTELLSALSKPESLPRAAEVLADLRATLKHVRSGRDALQHVLSQAREQLKSVTEDLDALLLAQRAAPLARAMDWLLADSQRRYEEAKRVLSAMDFSDLLRRSRDLLRDNLAVRTREQGRFAVLLVDEFQDTSPLQAEILGLLIADSAASTPRSEREPHRRPLYIVGDRKQSIYGFRGADVAAYEAVCQRLLTDGADEETLRVSRRSRPALIDFTNALFARVFAADATDRDSTASGSNADSDLLQHAGSVRWEDARDALDAAREESPSGRPLVEILGTPRPPKLTQVDEAVVETHADSLAVPASDLASGSDDPMGREAHWIALRIQELIATGTRAKDIVLLLRRFTHLLRYTGALTQASIPHYVVRGRGFFAAQEVLDLASFLSLLDDPHDRLALLAVLRSPLCALSDDALVQLHVSSMLSVSALRAAWTQQQTGHDPPAADPLRGLPVDERARLDVLLSLLSMLHESAARLGPAQCLQLALDHTDYLALLSADGSSSGSSLGQQRIANVQRLQERAAAHEARGGTLGSFVRALKQSTDPRVASGYGEGDDPLAPIAGEGDDVVRVMTIHQSKGLEFPVVIVAGCASPERSESPAIAYDRHVGLGLRLWQSELRTRSASAVGKRMPTLAARRIHALSRARALAESARLFYVAATRASERLILVGESKRSSTGTWRAYIDALAEARPDLLRFHTPQPPAPPTQPSAQPPSSPALDLATDSPVLARAASEHVRHAYTPLELPSAASVLTLSLSAAADLWICPRRYHLRHRFALHESEPCMPAQQGDDPIGDLSIAQLAVSLLKTEDLSSLRAAPQEALLLRGHDLRHPTFGEIATRLQRFLSTPMVARLLAPSAPTWVRDVPFDVPLSALRLRDTFDWMIGDVHDRAPASGPVHILRFRYGYTPDVASPLAQAQDQLLAWAARQHVGPDRVVHTAFCDLREPQPAPRFRAVSLSKRQEDVLDAMARDRQAALRAGPADAMALPRLPLRDCDHMRCGYRYLCWARSSAP